MFVKLYPKGRLPPTVVPALPAVGELHRLGFGEVAPPIPTADCAPSEWLGGDLLVVFEHLDATKLPSAFGRL